MEQLIGKRVHLLGIGGIGVSALARLLKEAGMDVSGCDVRPSSIIDALRAEGIPIAIGHSPGHVEENDILVHSTAIPEGNPELTCALNSGKTTLHRSVLLGALVDSTTSVGITGTNGKGTVSSMLAWILEVAGRTPGFYIGGLCPNLHTNARLGDGNLLVAELDESDGSLLNTHPRYALLNNLELDHLNYYRDLDHAVEVLTTFFRNLPSGAVSFFNADDPGAMRVCNELERAAAARPQRRVLFGRNSNARWRYQPVALSNTRSSFHWFSASDSRPLATMELGVPGNYNMENAAAALAVAEELGVCRNAARQALASYRGLENRYTVMEADRRTLIKDYMSHPMGILRVLDTARLGNPRRVIGVFKPYRYTMIRYHVNNYAKAFASADEVVLTEMWAGGEEPIPGVDTRWLADSLTASGLKVTYIPRMESIVDYLYQHQSPGETAVFFGGNDLFEMAHVLARRFREDPHG